MAAVLYLIKFGPPLLSSISARVAALLMTWPKTRTLEPAKASTSNAKVPGDRIMTSPCQFNCPVVWKNVPDDTPVLSMMSTPAPLTVDDQLILLALLITVISGAAAVPQVYDPLQAPLTVRVRSAAAFAASIKLSQRVSGTLVSVVFDAVNGFVPHAPLVQPVPHMVPPPERSNPPAVVFANPP